MRHALSILTVLSALPLAACGSVPIGSLVQMNRIDFETTDVAKLRVAQQLPGGLRPRPEGVAMDVVVKIANEPEQKTTFRLVETREAGDLAGLPIGGRPGFSTFVYRLASADASRLETIRAALIERRKPGARGSLAVGIAAKEFCLAGPLDPGPLLSTISLRTSETVTYVVASKDLDLRGEAEIAEALSHLGPC